MSLRLVMMGTGTFALPAFRQLLNSSHQVVGLVTQPDRRGRGHHQHVNPLKALAIDNGIDVFQPDKVNAPESLQQLAQYNADLYVVAAYGQILSSDLLNIPRLGAINLHGSLLPKFRGAAPVQYSVLEGESETGVTIFQIEPKLDAGPMLGVVTTEIGHKETSGQLHDRLAELSVPLTLKVVEELASGTSKPIVQPATAASRAPKIQKQQGAIDWSQSTQRVINHIFGMQPWPMPYTYLRASTGGPKRILILDADRVEDTTAKDILAEAAPDVSFDQWQQSSPGSILTVNQTIFVRTGDGQLEVQQLQPAGKRAMSAQEFLNGTPLDGLSFGPEDVSQSATN